MRGPRPSPFAHLVGHVLRLGVVAAVAWLVHATHQQRQASRGTRDLMEVPLATIQACLPAAAGLGGPAAAVAGSRDVVDAGGATIGLALRTSPAGDAAIGFSGPTDVLVVCDTTLAILGMSVLTSGDTRDHVRAVEDDQRFWESFVGMPLEALAAPSRRRAVAGSTLTSRAIAEALALRVGGTPPTSRFDTLPTQADIARLFPGVAAVDQDAGDAAVLRVRGDDAIPLGWLLRISPAADAVIGYQGPTDAVVGFDTENRVVGVLVLDSFDNEPYVGYVRDDRRFSGIYGGMTFDELAGVDPQATGIEGVSGATMTSQAVAEGIVRAAVAHARTLRSRTPLPLLGDGLRSWLGRIEGPQWGAIAVMLMAVVTAFTRLRGMWFGRLVMPVVVFAYLGYGAAALLSLGQLAGWVASGVPASAGVLTVLTAIAVAMPVATRRNVYCSHLCAHGAAQQILRRVAKPRRSLPAGLRPWLQRIPFVLLAGAILAVVLPLPLELVDLEPFDAYLPQIAGVAALTIWAVGLAASLWVPMAYCRFGCPTGALLDHLRLNRQSQRFSWRDGVLLGCLAVAVVRYGSLT